jgi:hypothetical protein
MLLTPTPRSSRATCIIDPDGRLIARLDYGHRNVLAQDIDLGCATRNMAAWCAINVSSEASPSGSPSRRRSAPRLGCQVFDHIGAHVVTYLVWIPRRALQEVLQTVGT